MARGPAYPYINLSDAVTLARKLFDFSKRTAAGLNAVFKEWGYSPTSSSAVKVIAALKYFGLVDVFPGSAKEDMVKITDRAYRILVDTPDSSERKKALQESCLSPKAYKLCWDTWGRDMPESMKSTLIFSHGFHDGTVDAFLINYKKSVQYAGLLDAEAAKKQEPERVDAKDPSVSVGDFVQWEHEGVLGFPSPLKLVKFSEDGSYAWVEGHNTGLPASELVKADAPAAPPPPLPPGQQSLSPVPQLRPKHAEHRAIPPKGVGMRQEVFSLTEGDVTIQWPDTLSQDSLEDFSDWLRILERKVKRSVVSSAQAAKPDGDPPDSPLA